MTHDNNNNNCSSSGEVEPVCFLRQLAFVVVVEVVVGAHVLERASSSSNLAECSTCGKSERKERGTDVALLGLEGGSASERVEHFKVV